MVYCTPSEKGSPMEFAYVEGLFADKDEDNEEIKQAYVRWFYTLFLRSRGIRRKTVTSESCSSATPGTSGLWRA